MKYNIKGSQTTSFFPIRYTKTSASFNDRKKGLRDYGTGIHESAHVLDWIRSFGSNYYEEALKQARKNIGLRANSKKYREYVFDLFNQETDLIYCEEELFAYFIETSKIRSSNAFANELYNVVKGYKHERQ